MRLLFGMAVTGVSVLHVECLSIIYDNNKATTFHMILEYIVTQLSVSNVCLCLSLLVKI